MGLMQLIKNNSGIIYTIIVQVLCLGENYRSTYILRPWMERTVLKGGRTGMSGVTGWLMGHILGGPWQNFA